MAASRYSNLYGSGAQAVDIKDPGFTGFKEGGSYMLGGEPESGKTSDRLSSYRTGTIGNKPIFFEGAPHLARPTSQAPTIYAPPAAPSAKPKAPRSTTVTQTSRFIPGEGLERPELDLPEYDMPEYDERKVKKLAQEHAAPGIRALRREVQSAAGKDFDNPNVKRMTVRAALEGYGMGLESVMSGARKTARAEYGQERSEQIQESLLNFKNILAEAESDYASAWKEYEMAGSQVATTKTR